MGARRARPGVKAFLLRGARPSRSPAEGSPVPAKPPTVAVTGLTGFVGRRLAIKLTAASIETRAIIRRSAAGLDARISPWVAALDDVDALAGALAGVDAVVHLAGTVRGARPRDFAAANSEAVTHLCAAALRQAKPPAMLLVSSLAATEPQLSDYAASKRAGEQALAAHPQIDSTVIRPPAVYGPGDREMTPLFRLMRRGWILVPGNPAQKLSFLYVDDLADAILCWLQAPRRFRGRQFSIDDGAEDGYDWPAIAAAAAGARKTRMLVIPTPLLQGAAKANVGLSRLLGRAPMLTPGKVRELGHDRWVGGGDDFAAATGWQPRHNLASGLELTFNG
ncbi:MAG: NAD-dependent epimerase/dehydratase family protein [Gammaproteobacteria bacterium]|nr:NAD-dependent epimerase/dehydratase family protein [Gammaproteobacteria bacterium]